MRHMSRNGPHRKALGRSGEGRGISQGQSNEKGWVRQGKLKQEASLEALSRPRSRYSYGMSVPSGSLA